MSENKLRLVMSDAKPMTTADVESMPKHTDAPHTYVAEYPNHVLVRRNELLATTRALEAAQTALAMRSHRTVEEITHAEKAEDERDEAENELDAAVARRDEVIANLDRIHGQVGPELARPRALVAELVAVLTRLERLASKVGFEYTCDAARDVLRKAKEAGL